VLLLLESGMDYADLEKFFGKQIHIELVQKVKIEKQRKYVEAIWV
jgi:hypothetical protein